MNYQRILDAVFACALFILIYLAVFGFPHAYAAAVAKSQQSGCAPFQTLGMMNIYRCYDDTNGKIFYLNNMGFMVYVGN